MSDRAVGGIGHRKKGGPSLTLPDICDACIDTFPAMVEFHGRAVIDEAVATGAYILFEDLFVPFVQAHEGLPSILDGVAALTERMLASDDREVRYLAEIGLLENFVSKDMLFMARRLGPLSRSALLDVRERMNFDETLWIHTGRWKERRGA